MGKSPAGFSFKQGIPPWLNQNLFNILLQHRLSLLRVAVLKQTLGVLNQPGHQQKQAKSLPKGLDRMP